MKRNNSSLLKNLQLYFSVKGINSGNINRAKQLPYKEKNDQSLKELCCEKTSTKS